MPLKKILRKTKRRIKRYSFSTGHIPFYVIAILLLYIGYLKYFECNQPTETTTVTETVLDSVKVDSLQQVISYLESLPPETIRVDIPVPVPTTEDSTDAGVVRWYDTNYTDDFIAASWRSKVNGQLLEQLFEYVPKSQRVVETKTVINRDYFYSTTTTIERVYEPKAYLSAGGFTGFSADRIQLGPMFHITSSNQNIYTIQYDVLNSSVLIGGSFKLSSENLLPW